MSNLLENIDNKISMMESNNDKRVLSKLTSNDIITLILQWGALTHQLRLLQDKMPAKAFIEQASRLSSLLSSYITQIGVCNDFIPLPESILLINHNQRFDLTAADSVTSLIYCSHKAIECLAIIASSNNSAQQS